MTFLKNVLELFGIVYLRFRMLPRVWCVWLVGVNAACLVHIAHVEAQVVLAVTALAVVVQALIYGRIGFTRVMGVAHVFWVPMFAWIFARWDSIATAPDLANWLIVLAATNAVSLVVDAAEVLRFLKGDRAPNYVWKRAVAA